MANASRRNSRASVSKKDSQTPQGLQFCHEDGRTYRPFTDPKRIETNDAKKTSKGDSRARVKGVPDDFLGVMPVGPAESSSPPVHDCRPPQAMQESVSSDIDSSTTGHREEVSAFAAPASQQLYSFDHNGSPDMTLHYGCSDAAGTIPDLHLDIEPSMMFPSVNDQLPSASCYTQSPDGSTPDSAYQHACRDSLHPIYSYVLREEICDRLTNGNAPSTDFDGSMPTDTHLFWEGSASVCSSDSGSSVESYKLDQIPDSFGRPSPGCIAVSTVAETLHEYCGSSVFIGPMPASQSPPSPCDIQSPFCDTGEHFMSGPDDVSQTFNAIPYSMNTPEQEYTDASQNCQQMYVDPNDLDLFNIGHNINTGDVQQGEVAYTHDTISFNAYAPCVNPALL